MLTLQNLQTLLTESQAIVERWQVAVDALLRDIQRLKKINAKYPDVMLEEVALRRSKAREVIGDKEQRLSQIAQIATAQEKFWADSAFLLSRTRFDEDSAKDAVIRARWLAELSAMSASTLQLVRQNALEESALALLWQCVLANQQRAEKLVALDLTAVVIPQQAEALAAIQQIQALADRGEELCERLRDTVLP